MRTANLFSSFISDSCKAFSVNTFHNCTVVLQSIQEIQ